MACRANLSGRMTMRSHIHPQARVHRRRRSTASCAGMQSTRRNRPWGSIGAGPGQLGHYHEVLRTGSLEHKKNGDECERVGSIGSVRTFFVAILSPRLIALRSAPAQNTLGCEEACTSPRVRTATRARNSLGGGGCLLTIIPTQRSSSASNCSSSDSIVTLTSALTAFIADGLKGGSGGVKTRDTPRKSNRTVKSCIHTV